MSSEEDFSGLFDPKTLDDAIARENNTGKYTRSPGYYGRANLRELANLATGNPKKLHDAKGVGDVLEGVTPGALTGLYSFADTALGAAQSAIGSDLPNLAQAFGVENPQPVRLPGAETAQRMYNESRDTANEFFGVEEIEGTGDFVFGALPTFVVPGPKLKPASTLLGKAGNVTAALTLPFAQSKIGTVRHGIESTVPVAIAEGAAALGDLPKSQYDSAFRSDEREDGLAALVRPAQDDDDDDLAALINPDAIDDMPHGDNQATNDSTRQVGVATAATLAAVGGVLATRRALNLYRNRPIPNIDQIHGEMGTKEALGAGTHAKKAFLDRYAPLPDAIRAAGGTDDDVKYMEDTVGTMLNPVSMSNIGTNALQFGQMPGMARRIESLGRIARTVGRFTPEDFDLYNRALAALDMVSRLKPGQIVRDAAGGAWDAARLNGIIHQAQRSPMVTQAIQRTRTWYDDMREVLLRNGIIDRAEYVRWGNDHPNYIHTQIDHKSKDGLLAQAMQAIGKQDKGPIPDSAVIRAFTQRNVDPQYGVLPGQGAKPLEMMEKYGQSVVRAVLENRNKRRFFREIERISRGRPNGIVKRVAKEGDKTISYFENGQLVHYRVDDSALHNALLNQPVLVVPILNAMRSAVHFAATGYGNPFFALTAGGYDTLLAPLMRMEGKSLGVFDEMIRKMTGGKYDLSNTIGIDPSWIINWPVGSLRHLYGAFVKEMSERLDASINANTAFSRSLNALGLPADQVLRLIDNAYMQSTHRAFMELGGGGNAALLQTPEALRTSIAQYAPEVAKHLERLDTAPANPMIAARRFQAGITAATAWRAYTALMNSLHAGVKFQHFAANRFKVPGETAKQARRRDIGAAKASRELTLDPSRTGDSSAYRIYASSTLWGNVGVQSLYQVSRAINDHPVRFFGMTAGLGFATFGWMHQMFGGDPELADYYFNTLTPTQRVQLGIPLYVDERGDIQFMPVDPVMRPVVATMTEMYGALSGNTAAHARTEEEQGYFSQAVNTLFGTSITEQQDDNIYAGLATGMANTLPGLDVPLVNLGARQLGFTPQNNTVSWLAQRGEMFTPEKDSMLSPSDERSIHATMPKFLENVLVETIGTIGRRIVEGVNTFGRVLRSDASPLTAADAALTQWQQSYKDADRGKPIQSLWTTHVNDKKIDTYNEISRRNRMSIDGISTIMEWGSKGIKGANSTGGSIKMDLPGTSVSLSGQKLLSLYSAVAPFRVQLQRPVELINDLQKKIEDAEKSPLLVLRPKEQRETVNALKMLIMEQQNIVYHLIQRFEDNAGRNLGKSFRLHDFDPEDWIDEEAIQQPPPLPREQ